MATESLTTDGTSVVSTNTSREQEQVEKMVAVLYHKYRESTSFGGPSVMLLKDKHIHYLQKGISHLSVNFECLDASRPWLCYWILHSLALLGHSVSDELAHDVIVFLSKCQSHTGGFAGGPGQLPHLAPTYAAILALCTIGTEKAFRVIDRLNLQRFLLGLHQIDGSFIMHDDGEKDIRGVYCALVSATLTNIMSNDLIENTGQWLAQCQTYEGGFSAVPGTEAHGGYTFCGVAGLVLLNKAHLCDVKCLLRWICRKQMNIEGGFQGRTNKLVDGCYSFWQGGTFPLIHSILREQGDKALQADVWQFNQKALQEYLLYCCQSPHGGLIDKPGKYRDFYHTCYCLSGLSVSQHCHNTDTAQTITVDSDSVLEPTNAVFNITESKVIDVFQYFSRFPAPRLIHEPAT